MSAERRRYFESAHGRPVIRPLRGAAQIQRRCSTSEEEDEALRRETEEGASGEASAVPASIRDYLSRSIGGGRSLSPDVRGELEVPFARPLSSVRIHDNEGAAQAATELGARAFTLGQSIWFGRGEYRPETAGGRRLLVHEVAHALQQQAMVGGIQTDLIVGSSGDPAEAIADRAADAVMRGEPVPALGGADGLLLQRQPSSPATPANPSPGPTTPGYEEAAHAPSFRVRIVAHASPRWRGARSDADADRRNLALSQRRAEAVRTHVEELLATHFVSGASVNVDTVIDDQDDGTVGVKAEARGSRDTLREAKGARSDDAAQRRRVDVIVDSSQRVSGQGGASRPLLRRSTASTNWHVNVKMSAGAAAGAAVNFLTIELTNDSSGQQMQGEVFAAGGGTKASVGTSAGIWGDATWFYTDDPVDFIDFDGVWVRYTNLGASAFLGYSRSYISFIGLGSGAQSLNVSGWNTGTVGFGGSVVAGMLSLDGPYPPTTIPIDDTDVTSVPYERTERGEDVHTVLFSTESATLTPAEVTLLDSFLASVVASRR